MSHLQGDKDRKVIPRWRLFQATVATGELAPIHPLKSKRPVQPNALQQLVRDWQAHRTASFAADLVSSAIALGEPDQAKDAADFIVNRETRLPATAIELARRVLGLKPPTKIVSDADDLNQLAPTVLHQHIHATRARLRDEPRNVFLWSDLAHQYTTLGHVEQAERMFSIARKLAPTNRYLLRSVSRFLLHVGESRRAHELLKTHERTRHDPWLMAAEIAVAGAARRSPKFVGAARDILGSGRISPFHSSELASAVGTVRLEAGDSKRGRKLIQQSLAQPTENSIAQAAWTDRRFGGIDLSGTLLRESFEAKAWQYSAVGRWDRSLAAVLQWLRDQPFSSRPATLGSYLAAVAAADFRTSIAFARIGLTANPDDVTLRNNLVVASVHLGDIKGAQRVFETISADKLHGPELISVLATSGLLRFREGNADLGRNFYMQAIHSARADQDAARAALATVYLAMEELHARTPIAMEVAERAMAMAQADLDSIFIPLRERLRVAMEEYVTVRSDS